MRSHKSLVALWSIMETRLGLLVKLIPYLVRTSQLDDEIESLQIEKFSHAGRREEIQGLGVNKTRGLGINVGDPEDLYLQFLKAIFIQKLEKLVTSVSSADDRHVERNFRVFSGPDLDGVFFHFMSPGEGVTFNPLPSHA